MPSNVIPMEPAYPLYQSFKNRINLLPDICLKLSKHELDDLQWKFSTAKTWALQFPFNNLSIVISVQWSEHCNFRRTISVRPELVEGLSELVCNRLASTLLQAQGIRRMPVQAYGKCRTSLNGEDPSTGSGHTVSFGSGILRVSVQAYWECRFSHTESVGSGIRRVSAHGDNLSITISVCPELVEGLSLNWECRFKGGLTESIRNRVRWESLDNKGPWPEHKIPAFFLVLHLKKWLLGWNLIQQGFFYSSLFWACPGWFIHD